MPFRLMNAGATYQRIVTEVIDTQIGRNLKVYVDCMIAKGKQAIDHVAGLRKPL